MVVKTMVDCISLLLIRQYFTTFVIPNGNKIPLKDQNKKTNNNYVTN
jgi:hypothetical protein